MAENSKIQWTDHTFNPWIGCTKVSPGCAYCYAETLMDSRYHRVKWGKGQPRVRTSDANWRLPLKWNKLASESRMLRGVPYHSWGTVTTIGRSEIRVNAESIDEHKTQLSLPQNEWLAYPSYRPRVFCASLADWLDDEVPIELLTDLLNLIRRCENLDWQLLTKRPENWKPRMIEVLRWLENNHGSIKLHAWLLDWVSGDKAPVNVWVGATVENQEMANRRIPALRGISAAVRFLSCEPLLSLVDLKFPINRTPKFPEDLANRTETKREEYFKAVARATYIAQCEYGIHWVICGGESGPHARPMYPDWARSLRGQCQAVGIPFFFKQWGEWMPAERGLHRKIGMPGQNGNIWAWCDGTRDGWKTGPISSRVGKRFAGRLLDGREWNEFPTT